MVCFELQIYKTTHQFRILFKINLNKKKEVFRLISLSLPK